MPLLALAFLVSLAGPSHQLPFAPKQAYSSTRGLTTDEREWLDVCIKEFANDGLVREYVEQPDRGGEWSVDYYVTRAFLVSIAVKRLCGMYGEDGTIKPKNRWQRNLGTHTSHVIRKDAERIRALVLFLAPRMNERGLCPNKLVGNLERIRAAYARPES
jgi:hypothetical protein